MKQREQRLIFFFKFLGKGSLRRYPGEKVKRKLVKMSFLAMQLGEIFHTSIYDDKMRLLRATIFTSAPVLGGIRARKANFSDIW